jgi:hypothetical protein
MNTGNSILADAHPITPYHEALREHGYKPTGTYRVGNSNETKVVEYKNHQGHEVVGGVTSGKVDRFGISHRDDGPHVNFANSPEALKSELSSVEKRKGKDF